MVSEFALSPKDYIQAACELHLQARLPSEGSASCIQQFLSSDAMQREGTDMSSDSSPLLFVWIPIKAITIEGYVEACASTDKLDADNRGAIVFLNLCSITTKHQNQQQEIYQQHSPQKNMQLSCIVLSPRIIEEKVAFTEEEDRSTGHFDSATQTLKCLQMFTRCFLPVVRAIESKEDEDSSCISATVGGSETHGGGIGESGSHESTKRSLIFESLQDKLRQLDVAFDQVQRTSTGITVVHLHTHPILSRAARSVTDVSKVNLEGLGLANLLQNDSFLNEVQSLVQTQWISSIQKITNLPRETPFPTIGIGSVMEEVRFWKSLQEALASCRSELAKPEVAVTIKTLKSANRFLATIALENNTGLDEAEAITSDINAYLQQIPFESLLSAREITRIQDSVKNILSQLPRARQSRYYDLDRLVKLVEGVTFTLSIQLVDLLKSKYNGNEILLQLKYDAYLSLQDSLLQLFDTWDLEFMKFKDWFVDYARKIKWTSKENKSLTPTKIIDSLKMHHAALRERLEQISYFRSQHERLVTVFAEVLGDDDPLAVREVEEAPFAVFATVDVLNLDAQGSAAFSLALEAYDRRMDVMEERLCRLLRTKLEAAADAEELFRVFARFNPLLFRNRVRAAVKDFQRQLIETVTCAITNLLSKFSEHYETSPSATMASARGIPPISGKIVWVKQIERQVLTWMSRMSNVLGDDWGQQLEGRTLRRSCDELLAKLDVRSFLRSWILEWEKELILGSNSRLDSFPIIITDCSNSKVAIKYEARVNMELKMELLFREMRTLIWLGFEKDIPRTLRSLSDEAVNRFPYAITLRSSLRSYTATRKFITPELEPLLEKEIFSIRDVISEVFDVTNNGRRNRVKWDSPSLGLWVTKLSQLVTHFENRVDIIARESRKLDNALQELKTCPYTVIDLVKVVSKVQKAVDALSLAGYSYLGIWIDSVVEMRMQEVLVGRLESAIQLWIDSLRSGYINSQYQLQAVHVEIVLRNQKISSSPSPQVVRSILFNHFIDFIGIVLNLHRPSGSKFEVFEGSGFNASANLNTATFHFLILRLSPELLSKAYMEAESHIKSMTHFVGKWLSYQSLWDTRLLDVTTALSEDLSAWYSTLVSARVARAALDTTSCSSNFGPIEVQYSKVQNQVQLKYDLWQQTLEAEYANVLLRQIKLVYSKISDARSKLELISLLEGTTSDLVSSVTLIETYSQSQLIWEKEVSSLQESESLLKKQRHTYQSEWVETSRVWGQYVHFEQILGKRRKAMLDSMPVLQQRIIAEDTRHKNRMTDVLRDWENFRPLRGNIAPSAALETIGDFQVKLNCVASDEVNMRKAKSSLGMQDCLPREADALNDALQELSDLKEVWTSMLDPYSRLQNLKDILWTNITPRKVRLGLEELMKELRSLPNRVRQYDAYTQMLDTLKQFVSGNSIIADLKTEALKERHWKAILSLLQIQVPLSDVSVGMLWEKGVIFRRRELSEILTVAQGEMAIEIFLSDVKNRWTKQELELVLYQNRIRLIKGWDHLFASLDDHMGGLALMKSSPYYRSVREFQEECAVWDERLSKLRASFDIWIDVQRRWVYLEGVLFGSADIKAQLPAEWSRFKNVDGEFVTLMRRIAQRPYAMEVLNIDNLQRNLERLANLMALIQRALGEYLEHQRTEFSRFYFLGDDDLLEIVGISGEPNKVLSHVGKMFAGMINASQAELSLQDKNMVAKLDGMISKDGEIVPLDEQIEIASSDCAKKWLYLLESRMQSTLAKLLDQAVHENSPISSQRAKGGCQTSFLAWAETFPAQIMILAALVSWNFGVEAALSHEKTKEALVDILIGIEAKLEVMAESVLTDLQFDLRKKYEQLITELVHQRDVTRALVDEKLTNRSDFRWLRHLRFQFNSSEKILTKKLSVCISNATFLYGFEYIGIGERLVQTPLTDRCYLTLTQALHFRLGGNPFGPAGTGKTESVKALGSQLGRFVVVMNCDETFDFAAMGRIFCGLCQVGAWGCFDEFNRLEERILSAVSQQILTIQRGLINRHSTIELLGRPIKLHENVGIFVTMNPGYAGRSNLPENLKNLFRAVAMVVPDHNMIAQVMLFSQGIATAELLSDKIVTLFHLCEEEMTKQRHYDFGLRALKTLLISGGGLKRKALNGLILDAEKLAIVEQEVLIEGACSNIVPKLVPEDILIFEKLLSKIFPGSNPTKLGDTALTEALVELCRDSNFEMGEMWVQKILQLKLVIEMRHGVVIVGPVAVGKSAALRILSRALERIDGIKGELYTIEPKALNKEALYGSLDGTTLEWTDGVFTSILRKIISNERGEADRRHWIIFDGDVDPEWAENLNSVLDDNKLLTLPSGERLVVPDNLRIILEVDSLENATHATVSRCGMVWFSAETLSSDMRLKYLIESLRTPLLISGGGFSDTDAQVRTAFVEQVEPFISGNLRSSSLVRDALEFSLSQPHIMPPSRERLLVTLKTLLMRGIEVAVEYNEDHPDIPICGDHLRRYATNWMLYSLLWSFAGSASWEVRNKFSDMVLRITGAVLPHCDTYLGDYLVRVQNGEFELWNESVPRIELESHKITATDVVVPTADTLRHADLVFSWLRSRKPVILCGAAGVGKSMSLISALQSSQNIVLASLNFSSKTTTDIIMKTFNQYCRTVRRGKDIILEPSENYGSNTWLVVFCDEINLPERDSYGTQRVIMFMRQLVEQQGFWRHDNVWVNINRIQFVGACNPPDDAGRVEFSARFLRHVPILFVDFPARDSLLRIYRAFNGGMLRLFPNLRGECDVMTEAMVDFYTSCQIRFTPEMQPQYFFSPRELSRWVRGIYEAISNMDHLSREELLRIWAHEALRLFGDRLVEEDEREWCERKIDDVAKKWLPNVDHEKVLRRPIYFTNWLSRDKKDIGSQTLRDFLCARLRVFYEEELNVPLVVFDEVLQHVLRIDRVLRQPMGHCLLIGDSGSGKTVLSKFVSWMNGLRIFQIKAHSRYSLSDFNDDLRQLMRRVGADGEKVCFIFDESNALESGFLEAMNAILASGEVPGLFEGDDRTTLLHAVRESASKEGLILDNEEELWRRFTILVQRNLHVIFTMNPSGGEWKNRSTTSPALFNRCVVDWFGTWSCKALGQVGKEFTNHLDMGSTESSDWTWGVGGGGNIMKQVEEAFEEREIGGLHHAVVAAMVHIHMVTKQVTEELAASSTSTCRTYISPRDFLTLIHSFVDCVNDIRTSAEDEQLRISKGLAIIRQTQEKLAELELGLGKKGVDLSMKESLANQKLLQMVADQTEAEKRKEAAVRLSAELEKQQNEINARKDEVKRDLEEAEPALLCAQTSVKGIKRRDLDEVRGLVRPPNAVKLTLECVAVMMNEKSLEWADIRKMLSRAEFIPSILNFDVDTLTSRQIKIVTEKYLEGNSDLTVDSVTRSSKACGPLFAWAVSQVKFHQVYTKVQPLRQEVAGLEHAASEAENEKKVIEGELMLLEESIARYKGDYAMLIRDVEALKSEMDMVQKKVARARSLITSLTHESDRWMHSSDSFQVKLRNCCGDSLLLASFLTYAGFFDFKTRATLMENWRLALDMIGIDYCPGLNNVEMLSKPSDRLHWQHQGLPGDSLSLENGVILDRCIRFPLIIDPSGHAIDFLMNKYNNQKVQTTSFSDKAFMKTLAGAIRFGTALIVENVETIDPVLNPILNREIQTTGGRSLVRVGTEDIDYSPKFKLILSTKDPAVKLTPDLCSRVTILNFTVTPDSLESQSLSLVVKSENPEVEEQRINLVKHQGEQSVKLRELEEEMLGKIIAVKGSILDDDQVVEGMESLTQEGLLVEQQIRKSTQVMTEVNEVVAKFKPLGKDSRAIFVLLESMRNLSFLYEFSSKFFMAILQRVLSVNIMNDKTCGSDERIAALRRQLYSEVASRVGRALLSEDKIVFSVLLANLYQGINNFSGKSHVSVEDITGYIEEVFGAKFPWQGRGLDYLNQVTEQDIDATVPLIFCSAPGHDVCDRVEEMARNSGKLFTAVAMGSEEGFALAEKSISSAAKNGTWVILKNAHLCTSWLSEILVRRLQALNPHPNFRIFITSEINPTLPISLLRMSNIIVAEAAGGVKASMSRFFNNISISRFKVHVKNRLYFLVAWIHAVIQERLRYIPGGWSKHYDFTEADANHAIDVIDSLVENSNGSNISPDQLPWEAIRATLCKVVFGGKITDPQDQQKLDELVYSVFVSSSFDVNFSLVSSDSSFRVLPDSSSRDDFVSWIELLPEHTSPTWIGLDSGAEATRAKNTAASIQSKIALLQRSFL